MRRNKVQPFSGDAQRSVFRRKESKKSKGNAKNFLTTKDTKHTKMKKGFCCSTQTLNRKILFCFLCFSCGNESVFFSCRSCVSWLPRVNARRSHRRLCCSRGLKPTPRYSSPY